MPAEPTELRFAIGQRIATLRKTAGLTQVATAQMLGRRLSWLAKIERGQRSVLFSEAVAIADALNVELADLWPDRDSSHDASRGHYGRSAVS